MEKINQKQMKKIIILIGIIFLLVLFSSLLAITTARYIKREKDAIIASYTALYMTNDGENRVVALEDNVGYMSFHLMNYDGEDVTKRDIVYSIKAPDTFYDEKGNEIEKSKYSIASSFYVLDVWGKPQAIGKDTYKYNIEVTSNSGKKNNDGDYVLEYETTDNNDIGKTHDIVLKIERTSEEDFFGNENISIVVQLSKPYKEVYIFDINITNYLIAFSSNAKQKFEIDYRTLYIQSINSYAYVGSEKRKKNGYTFLPNAIKLTITWNDLLLDLNALYDLHLYDGNFIESSNIDITKPFIVSINNSQKGSLVIYVPQASDFSLDFLEYGNNINLSVKVEVYVTTTSDEKYVIYDSSLGGYNVDERGMYYIIGGNND